jgi:hypothetical protein
MPTKNGIQASKTGSTLELQAVDHASCCYARLHTSGFSSTIVQRSRPNFLGAITANNSERSGLSHLSAKCPWRLLGLTSRSSRRRSRVTTVALDLQPLRDILLATCLHCFIQNETMDSLFVANMMPLMPPLPPVA